MQQGFHYTKPAYPTPCNSRKYGNLAILHSRRGVLDTQKLDRIRRDALKREISSVNKNRRRCNSDVISLKCPFFSFACVNTVRVYAIFI